MKALLFLSVAVLGSGRPAPPCDTDAQWQASTASAALRKLSQQGYTVVNTPTKRYTKGSAFGNNPSSLYGVYDFNITGTIVEPLGRLAERDAWIWIGCTPPQLEYFSQRSYVFNTPGDRSILFASLGDSNNHLTFNTTAGGPCNRTTAVITSADQTTAEDVAEALVAAGLPRAAINLDTIAPSLVRMGRTLVDSTFIVLFRVALFSDPAAGAVYTGSEWPVYHIAHNAPRAGNPFPVVPLRQRGTTHPESPLAGGFATLSTAIQALWAGHGSISLAQSGRPVPIDGYACIANKTDCAGDNHDAAYLIVDTPPFALKDNSTVLVVVGIDHTTAAGLVYSNLAVMNADTADGIAAVDNHKFNGSTTFFAPGVVPNPNAYYSYVVARDCLAPIVASLVGPFCLSVPASLSPLDAPLSLAERGYLQIDALTGPAYDELLMPFAFSVALQ